MFAESLIALVGLLAVQAQAAPAGDAWALHELPVAKYAAPSVAGPVKKDPENIGVEISARSAAIVDVASGNVLYQKDAESASSIASLTKLVTAMTFLDEHPNLNEEVEIQPDDLTHEGEEPFPALERLTKLDVLHALLVGSINTAANVLARTSDGGRTAFIARMNDKARALHLLHASFVEPTGLDPRDQASAKDVALMLRAALSYPEIRAATELNQVGVKGRTAARLYTIKSTNLLLGSFLNKNPYHIVAAKTGSLPEAGYCLAQATRDQDGNEVIAVVLGSENHFARFQDAKALTAWAFEQFLWPKQEVGAALANP